MMMESIRNLGVGKPEILVSQKALLSKAPYLLKSGVRNALAVLLPALCVAGTAEAQSGGEEVKPKASESTYLVLDPANDPVGIPVMGTEIGEEMVASAEACESCLVEVRCDGFVREEILFSTNDLGHMIFRFPDLAGRTVTLKCAGDKDTGYSLYVRSTVPLAPLPGMQQPFEPAAIMPPQENTAPSDFPGSGMIFDALPVDEISGAPQAEEAADSQLPPGVLNDAVDPPAPLLNVEPAKEPEPRKKWTASAGAVLRTDISGKSPVQPLGVRVSLLRRLFGNLGGRFELAYHGISQRLAADNKRFQPLKPDQTLNGSALVATVGGVVEKNIAGDGQLSVGLEGGAKAGAFLIGVPGASGAAIDRNGYLADVPDLFTAAGVAQLCGGISVGHRSGFALGADFCGGVTAPIQEEAGGETKISKEGSAGLDLRYSF